MMNYFGGDERELKKIFLTVMEKYTVSDCETRVTPFRKAKSRCSAV